MVPRKQHKRIPTDLRVSGFIPYFEKGDFNAHCFYTLLYVFGTNVPVRIVGIDTPELASKCSFPMERLSEVVKAKEAREFVKAMLSNAKEITLANVARDKYFRVLADVYVDGVSLSELLIENKLAFSYDGGTKRSWCGE